MWLGVTPCVHGLERYAHTQPRIGAPPVESEDCADWQMLLSQEILRNSVRKVCPGSLVHPLKWEFLGPPNEILFPKCFSLAAT